MTQKPLFSYKKITSILMAVTAAALIVCAAALLLKQDSVAVQASPEQSCESYYSPNAGASQEKVAPPASGSSPSPARSPSGAFVVTVYEGKIGVFQAGREKPFLTADVDVYLLPEADRALLKKGIRADTLSQVKGILEDYE